MEKKRVAGFAAAPNCRRQGRVVAVFIDVGETHGKLYNSNF